MQIAYGKIVSGRFVRLVMGYCDILAIPDPSFLMACMAFETATTFRPDIRNAAGSGAIGLIQFMPSTALALGTTSEDLAQMTAEDQLTYVLKYLMPLRNRLKTLSDIYMAILWPAAVGRSEDFVLFDQSDPNHPKRYIQNQGLDFNKDGKITKAEATARVQQKLDQGLTDAYAAIIPTGLDSSAGGSIE